MTCTEREFPGQSRVLSECPWYPRFLGIPVRHRGPTTPVMVTSNDPGGRGRRFIRPIVRQRQCLAE